MACSLEARLPYLDHELIELSALIPAALKLKGLQEKYILRQAVREILPREIVQRKKRGLAAPIRQWLGHDLPGFATELLSERSLREKGYFSPERVSHLLRQHRAGQGNWASELLGVLGVQLWDDLFVRGKMRSP